MMNPICKQLSGKGDTSLSVFCHLVPKKKVGFTFLFGKSLALQHRKSNLLSVFLDDLKQSWTFSSTVSEHLSLSKPSSLKDVIRSVTKLSLFPWFPEMNIVLGFQFPSVLAKEDRQLKKNSILDQLSVIEEETRTILALINQLKLQPYAFALHLSTARGDRNLFE